MASAFTLPAPGLRAADLIHGKAAHTAKPLDPKHAKAKAAAQDFEAVFLNSMFQEMFTGIDGDGPFGGSGATGVWRSVLTDTYAKTIAKNGGIGIADQVYRSLLAHQAAGS
jgi:Rod binding domain-containing protein